MCGICGIVNLNEEPAPTSELLIKMMSTLKHRGPDSSGYYRDKKAALGHTRLAIIDLATGAQPLSNEDESIWITFNGEIFNYLELRDELIGKGHTFRTKSDTETIVHAWEEWGSSCFERFNGQWALALWDTKESQVILSRDRHGIRPLYYTVCGKRFLFASEVKAIFADESVERAFDRNGISEIFTFWSPVAPATTFKNIKELEPGHYAIIKDYEIKSRPYWTISFPKESISNTHTIEENVEALREHLIDASKLRFTRSDVPVGAYLSGGIDSSITSAIVSQCTAAPLQTFSLRFEDNEFDEGSYQKEMSNRLGTDHQDVIISQSDIGNIFPEVIRHTERPILRTAPAPLYLLSKLVRESGYKVVVTGEGGDEVLAGYDIFRENEVRRFIAENPDSPETDTMIENLYPWMKRSPSKAPAFARAFFEKDLDLSDPGVSHRLRWNTTSSIMRMFNQEFKHETDKYDPAAALHAKLPENHWDWTGLSRAQWLEYTSLLSGYILSAQGDRMLMANSVEGRFPFLDFNLVDFANNLPSEHKLYKLDEKHILKKAFANTIPESIVKRPKQPYRAPDAASFFFDNSPDWINQVTDESIINEAGIFNPIAVQRLITKCKKQKGMTMSNTDNMRIVAVLSTMLTYTQFIKCSYKRDYPLLEPETVIDRT